MFCLILEKNSGVINRSRSTGCRTGLVWDNPLPVTLSSAPRQRCVNTLLKPPKGGQSNSSESGERCSGQQVKAAAETGSGRVALQPAPNER